MNSLGERIYNLRIKGGLSQGKLADSLGVSRQTISKWENDQSIPELERLLAMSEIFGVSVDYIVKGEEDSEVCGEKENPVSAEKEQERKTVIINPTKNYLSGIAVGVSTIFFFSVLSNTVSLFSNFLNGYAGSNLFSLLAGTAVNLFAIASLMSLNMNLVFISCVARVLLTSFELFSDGTEILSVVSAAAYGIIAFMCMRADKRNAKPLCISAISLFVLYDVLYLGLTAYNFYTVASFTAWSIITSLLTMIVSMVPMLIFNVGVCTVIYLKANPLPDREVYESTELKKEMYVPLAKHILLTLFTLGIYSAIWICKITEGLNRDGVNEKQKGFRKLLLCTLVPFYRIYWYYAQSKRLQKLMENEGRKTDSFAAVAVILALFLPLAVPSLYLQMKVNEFAEA